MVKTKEEVRKQEYVSSRVCRPASNQVEINDPRAYNKSHTVVGNGLDDHAFLSEKILGWHAPPSGA